MIRFAPHAISHSARDRALAVVRLRHRADGAGAVRHRGDGDSNSSSWSGQRSPRLPAGVRGHGGRDRLRASEHRRAERFTDSRVRRDDAARRRVRGCALGVPRAAATPRPRVDLLAGVLVVRGGHRRRASVLRDRILEDAVRASDVARNDRRGHLDSRRWPRRLRQHSRRRGGAHRVHVQTQSAVLRDG